MKNIVEILNEIRNTQRTNAKIEVLESYADNDSLKTIIELVYNPAYVFGVTNKTVNFDLPYEVYAETEVQIEMVVVLISTLSKGNLLSARDYVNSYIGSFNKEVREFVGLCLRRNFDIGLNKKNFNKVYGEGFIPETPYMGANPYDKDVLIEMLNNHHPYVFSEEKYDGRYANLIAKLDRVIMVSRNGKNSSILSNIEEQALILQQELKRTTPYGSEYVFNGELIIKGVDRYTSNGLISSILSCRKKQGEGKFTEKDEKKFFKEHGMTLEDAASRVVMVVWDFIPYDLYSTNSVFEIQRDYRVRLLTELFGSTVTPNIELADIRVCETFEAAINHYHEIEAKGGEGTIAKTLDGYWKNGKPKWQLKLKKEFDCEMKIIGFKAGDSDGKFKDTLGSLICESSDGIVKADANLTGKESIRDEIWNNQEEWLNKIVKVRCNGLSSDKEGNFSLLHPRYIEERDDKDDANNLEEIKKIDKSVMSL